MSFELGDGTNQHCQRLCARQREFEFGEKHFSLEELVIGTQADSQIDSSKIVYETISHKEDKESANEENMQFDPGGKWGEPPL